MRRFLLAFIFSALSFYGQTTAQSKIENSAILIKFAEELFNLGEYYRAITEYMRIRSYFSSVQDSINIDLRIAECYYFGDRLEESASAYKSAYRSTSIPKEKNYALFKLADINYRLARYDKAEDALYRLLEVNDAEYNGRAKYFLGYMEASIFNWSSSAKWLNSISNDHPWYSNAEEISFKLSNPKLLPRKNPVMAGILSAIIPGSGYCYTGNCKIGGASFILNTLFILGAVEAFKDRSFAIGTTFAVIGSGWYTGNIFGSVSKAHRYNASVKTEYFLRLNFVYR